MLYIAFNDIVMFTRSIINKRASGINSGKLFFDETAYNPGLYHLAFSTYFIIYVCCIAFIEYHLVF